MSPFLNTSMLISKRKRSNERSKVDQIGNTVVWLDAKIFFTVENLLRWKNLVKSILLELLSIPHTLFLTWRQLKSFRCTTLTGFIFLRTARRIQRSKTVKFQKDTSANRYSNISPNHSETNTVGKVAHSLHSISSHVQRLFLPSSIDSVPSNTDRHWFEEALWFTECDLNFNPIWNHEQID